MRACCEVCCRSHAGLIAACAFIATCMGIDLSVAMWRVAEGSIFAGRWNCNNHTPGVTEMNEPSGQERATCMLCPEAETYQTSLCQIKLFVTPIEAPYGSLVCRRSAAIFS